MSQPKSERVGPQRVESADRPTLPLVDLADDPQFECTACGRQTTTADGDGHLLRCDCGGFLRKD